MPVPTRKKRENYGAARKKPTRPAVVAFRVTAETKLACMADPKGAIRALDKWAAKGDRRRP